MRVAPVPLDDHGSTFTPGIPRGHRPSDVLKLVWAQKDLTNATRDFIEATQKANWQFKHYTLVVIGKVGHSMERNKLGAGPAFFCSCGNWQAPAIWSKRYSRQMFLVHRGR